MPGHNAALQVLGTFFLWIGWYGFNPGSTLRISTPHMSRVAARTVLTTTLSAVAGGLTSCIGNKLPLTPTPTPNPYPYPYPYPYPSPGVPSVRPSPRPEPRR